MATHTNSIESTAKHTSGQQLAAKHHERQELLATNRSHTQALMAAARKNRFETESKRRHQAAQEAAARRLFVSELRSGVHALRHRFALARRDMAAGLQHMADELRAARGTFRNRPAPSLETAVRRAPRPAAHQAQPSQPPPLLKAHLSEPAAPARPRARKHAATAGQPKEKLSLEARPRHTHREKPAPSKKRQTDQRRSSGGK